MDYYIAFEQAKVGIFSVKWETLFFLLLKICTVLFPDPQWFLTICSLFILLGIGIFIKYNIDESESAFWPVFFFIVLTQYFSSMNLLRQSLAMAVGCNAYTVLNRNHRTNGWLFGILLVIISMLFHSAGIICFLLFIPFMIHINRKTMFFGLVAAGIGFLLYPSLLSVFLRILPKYSRYIGGRFDEAGSSGYYLMLGFIELLMGVLYVIYIPPVDNQESYRILFIVLFSFALIVMQRRISLAIRLGYFFEIFVVLLIPEFINKWKAPSTRAIIKMAVYFFGWVYYIYSMTVSNARGCVPYTFFWQN